MNQIPFDLDSAGVERHRVRRARGRADLRSASFPGGTTDGRPRSGSLARAWAVRQRVGGVLFVAATPQQAARDLVAAAVNDPAGEHVHLANAYSVALSAQSPALAMQTFCSDGWNLPDGRPVSLVSRFRRDAPGLSQVRGPQFFLDVCREGVAAGLRHYLLGGTPETLEALRSSLLARFPGISIVGVDSPPFREATDDEFAARDEAISNSGAQIVWVGLGTPKQDLEVARLARSVPVFAVAVGAAFDYTAGTLKEAPAWMSRAGLEWVFRLSVEPRRLWKRYLFGNLRFLRAVVRPSR